MSAQVAALELQVRGAPELASRVVPVSESGDGDA